MTSELEKPAACYFDIDGTIVGQSGDIHPVVLQSIQKLHDAGIAVGIATGRPWFAALPIAEQISTNAPCLSYFGALLCQRSPAETIFSRPLKEEDIRSVVTLARKQNWYLELYDQDRYYVDQRSYLSTIHAEYLDLLPIEVSLDQIAAEHCILKAVIAFDGALPAHAIQLLQSEVKNTEIGIGYGAAHPNLHFINLTSLEAKRVFGLQAACDLIRCNPQDIMAFGDGEADIPFLSHVGWGVAMSNAPMEVKKAARFVTSSVEENGVAVFIDSLIAELP